MGSYCSKYFKAVVPESSSVNIYAEHLNCNMFCSSLGVCIKPLRFDTNAASSHVGLINFMGGDQRWGKTRIEQKFSDLNKDLERRHSNSHLVIWPILILLVTAGYVTHYLSEVKRLKCKSTNVCENPITINRTETESSDWATNCCYIYCNDSNNSMAEVNNRDPGCHPVVKIIDDIKKNKPFELECYLQRDNVKNRTSETRKCGKIQLYGDFKDVYYIPPHLQFFFSLNGFPIIFFLPAALILFFYTKCGRNIQEIRTNKIIQCCLQDWKKLGIKVWYYSRSGSKSYELLTLDIPPLQVEPSQYILNQNY